MKCIDTGCILMVLLYMYSAEVVTSKRFDAAKLIERSGNDGINEEFDDIIVNNKLMQEQGEDGQDDQDESLSNYGNSKKFKNGEYNGEKEEPTEMDAKRHRSKRGVRMMEVEDGKELNDKMIGEKRKVISFKSIKDEKKGNEREENEKAEDVRENRGFREDNRSYEHSNDGEKDNMKDDNIDEDGMTEEHGRNLKHQVPEFTDAKANTVPDRDAYVSSCFLFTSV